MYPFILWKNAFEYGTLSATDTDADIDYSVDHIIDWRLHTKWKAASVGTKYITASAVSGYDGYPTAVLATDTGAIIITDLGEYIGVTTGEVDTIGLAGHNFGTVGAAVSLESSDDGITWTERLSVFTVANDKPIIKTFTAYSATYHRLKIVSPSSIPEIAVVCLGSRMQFPMGLSREPNLYTLSVESELTTSKTGNPLSAVIRYNPIDISHEFTIKAASYEWRKTYFNDFLEDHGLLLKPFFYAPYFDEFPELAYFAWFPSDAAIAMAMKLPTMTDTFTLAMKAVLQ